MCCVQIQALTSKEQSLRVEAIDKIVAARLVCEHHYMRRRPPMTYAFGLIDGGDVVGVCTFGVPASRHMMAGACPSDPSLVLELNRLWCSDHMPRNTESWFVSRCLKALPPRIILSYADTAEGHMGFVYRACNFNYAGWTDMDRRTPRFDYLVPGKHTRAAFRSGDGVNSMKVRRKPKVKYWTATGGPADRRNLTRLCCWPRLDWKFLPPPTEHVFHLIAAE